jgi:hypothetical protein
VRQLLLLLLAAACAAAQSPDAAALFSARCASCHGGEAPAAALNLSTGEGIARVVDAAQPSASRLLHMVESGQMPKAGPKLTADQIATIRTWIAAGAKWSALTAQKPPQWWSLKTPIKPAVPNISAAKTPIDAFLLARLREKSLQFSPQATHPDLIRRLHFNLTGLPPKPEDLQLTFEQTVEKLLASRSYAERWARHWLDVVRFGETDGGEHNYERPHAWRYRDYVITAFRNDLPYNQFVTEQLAGDLLSPNDVQTAAATGFLTAGPWDSVSAELNKDALMRKAARMDEFDDMITTTFHTFQGLTVNCARCHDHKFDPIPTRDYYRLASVFASVGFGNREVAPAEEKARINALRKPVTDKIAALQKQIDEIELPVKSRLLRAKLEALDRARAAEPRRIPLNPVFNRAQFPALTTNHFRLTVNGKPARIDWLRILPNGPELSNLTGNEIPLPAVESATGLAWSTDARYGRNDGAVNVYQLESSSDGATWQVVARSLDHVSKVELDMPSVTDAELTAALTPQAATERDALAARRAALRKELESLPAVPLVYGAKPVSPEPVHILERGSVSKPGPQVEPAALSSLTHRPPELPTDENPRLALARWITDPRNPLTARVIVNRVWFYHFGNGLVNTPSDFGRMGDRPSHPELLDWLAVSFMENGWSLKWLHRQILATEAYKQSNQFREQAHAVDADNRLLWRMPLRRMDAETLRDSMLAVTASLQPFSGGPSFALQKRGSNGSYIYAPLDNDGPAVWQRAVYRFVVRGGERIFLDSFDCPDPSVATPQRNISNTPVQALTLLNNAFVLRQSQLLAERLRNDAGQSLHAQIRRAYQLLYLRAPTAAELQKSAAFAQRHGLPALSRVLFNTNEFVYTP